MKILAFLIIIFISLSTVQALNYSGGSGEPNDPYQIATAQDLINLGNEPNDYDKHFIMTSGIDLFNYTFQKAPIAPDNITENTPFNNDIFDGTKFTGVFNGNGYSISNLNIKGGYHKDYLGLFGFIDGAIIKNLYLESIQITGDYNIGGLAGYNQGTFINCYIEGSINGDENIGNLVGINYGNISNCYAAGSLDGHMYLGGLVGKNYGNIINCYAASSLNGDGCLGGLVGYNYGNIMNCFATGSLDGDIYIGGLVGKNYFNSNIINCYSNGSVTGDDEVGGLVGNNSDSGNLANSFWDIETSGQTGSDGGTGLTTAQMTNRETFSSASWDFIGESANGTSQIWQMSTETGYPVLSSFNGYTPITLSGDGSQNSPYLIDNAHDLGAIYYYDSCAYYKLTSNIDLNDIQWTRAIIPVFNGNFDGNNFVIKDMNIVGGNYSGLFGKIDSTAIVTNLGLENVFVSATPYLSGLGSLAGQNDGSITNCSSSGKVTGYSHVGGLVGDNRNGSIENCYSTSEVNGDNDVGGLVGYNWDGNISDCYTTSKVSGEYDVSGLAGFNGGTITSSSCTGTIIGNHDIGGLAGDNNGSIKNCYSTSEVNGDYVVGGLVGENTSSITSCYSQGSVSGNLVGGLAGQNDGNITNCYSTGSVNGNSSVGGLVGSNNYGSITNCYSTGLVEGNGSGGLVGSGSFQNVANSFWDIETSGQSESDGGTGLTTIQMKIQETFTTIGWDFLDESTNGLSEIWQMSTETGYPVLSSFNGYTPITLNGDGSQNNPYLINNAAELGALYHYDSSACYKLTSNLDLNDIQWSTAVVPFFDGSFDGNDFVIKDINIVGGDYSGMFGIVKTAAVISNLGIENVLIFGKNYIGILAADNHGSITNCYTTGKVSGNNYVGGLVGDNGDGIITNCYSIGTVNGNQIIGGLVGNSGSFASDSVSISNCYSRSSVTGNHNVGGLVGYVDSGKIINCYSTGTVDGNGSIGGLVGMNYYGSETTSCFWDIQTSGISTSEGGIGKTTAEMRDINTYLNEGWDFIVETDNGIDDIWIMFENDYPHLSWEIDL